MQPNSLCIVLLFLISCLESCTSNNKDIQQPQVNSKELTGVWEYRNRIGGMMPYTPDEFKPGNGNLWVFTQTSFQNMYKDTVLRSGTYSINRGAGTDLNTGRSIDQFILNNTPAESFELRDDTLRLYYGAMAWDGDITMYVKIADDTLSLGQ